MDFEKKNLGIPVNLMVFLSYLIGYYLSNNLSALFVSVITAAIVFSFDFDDRVKVAITQSYLLAFVFQLFFGLLNVLLLTENLSAYWKIFAIPDIDILYQIGTNGLSILLFIVYFIFIISALVGKDIILGFSAVILDRISKDAVPMPDKVSSQPQKMSKRMKRLFPPIQQEYPPMPQVQPPAKPSGIIKPNIPSSTNQGSTNQNNQDQSSGSQNQDTNNVNQNEEDNSSDSETNQEQIDVGNDTENQEPLDQDNDH